MEVRGKKKKPVKTLIKWPMSDKELFFIMPRVLMNDMPDKWKRKMVKLLNEFSYFNFSEKIINNMSYAWNVVVRVTENGRFVKMPDVFKRFDK